jgi:DNA-binding response OmpR family regulator
VPQANGAIPLFLEKREQQVGKKILVIDDDELVRYGLERALRMEGVEVITAATASAALFNLSSCRYDLCLLDVHLPDLNGMQLLRIIKDICPRLRVIMMTASYIDDRLLSEHIQQAIAAGACQFIAKPFNLQELKEFAMQALRADNGFHTGFRFCDQRFLARKIRIKERKPFAEEVHYSLSVIENGANRRLLLQGRGVDINEYGLGMVTAYPLLTGQVISMEQANLNRSGKVVWSRMCEQHLNCRAGIHFA